MKTWKIKNVYNEPVKFACKLPGGSQGILLEPGLFCIVEAQNTAFIEIQERRNFIEIDKNFDNSKYSLKLGIPYSEQKLKIIEEQIKEKGKSKLDIAREKAKKYINKK